MNDGYIKSHGAVVDFLKSAHTCVAEAQLRRSLRQHGEQEAAAAPLVPQTTAQCYTRTLWHPFWTAFSDTGVVGQACRVCCNAIKWNTGLAW